MLSKKSRESTAFLFGPVQGLLLLEERRFDDGEHGATIRLGSRFCLSRHVLAQHPVHARLPAVAGGLEIGDDFGAVAHRDQPFGVVRAGASAQGFHRHHRIELRVRQGLGVRVAQGGGGDGGVLFHGRQDRAAAGAGEIAQGAGSPPGLAE